MFNDLEIPHAFVDADLLEGEEQDTLLAELRAANPQCSFPTVVVDEQVIIGFKVQEIKEAIAVHTEVDDLYDRLRTVQEAKGY